MNDITLYDKFQDPLAAMDRMGEALAKSGMFGCDRPEQGKVLAMICLSERKSPTEIMRTYHIIDGKLSKKALAALAEFRGKGGKHKWIKAGDDGTATGEFTFEGNTITVSYSIDEAKKAGVWRAKSAWEKQPGNMLRARVITNAIGMLAPEIFAGGDEDDVPRSAGPEMQLITPAAVAQPQIAAPETIVVAATDEKAEADAGLAPAMPTPPPAPVDNGLAAPIQLRALKEIIERDPAYYDLAMKFFVEKNWLMANQSVIHLSSANVKKILDKPDAWLRVIQKGGAK